MILIFSFYKYVIIIDKYDSHIDKYDWFI